MFALGRAGTSITATAKAATTFKVVNQQLGRVALEIQGAFISVGTDGTVSLRRGRPSVGETFQWIETFTGELTLLSLKTNRYLRVNVESGTITADSVGPEPGGPEGVRFSLHR
jgi:hypothetical protein